MLIGVRQEDGTLSILPQPLPVDEAFVAKANAHPLPPEQRFRFTNKCIEGACKQWTGTGCGVAARAMAALDRLPANALLPDCGIRHECRWYSEQGRDACRICPFVLTEITEAEVLAFQAAHPLPT
jgi:hypothetical protein